MMDIKISIDLNTWTFVVHPLGVVVEIPDYDERQEYLQGNKLMYVTFYGHAIILPRELFQCLEEEIYKDRVVKKALSLIAYD